MEAVEKIETGDTPAKPKAAPKRRKTRKAAARRAAPRQPKAAAPHPASTEEFPGMTGTECSFECTPEHCCISGSNFCGHPNKGGGTQPALLRNPDAVRRYNAARRQLAHAKVDRA